MGSKRLERCPFLTRRVTMPLVSMTGEKSEETFMPCLKRECAAFRATKMSNGDVIEDCKRLDT